MATSQYFATALLIIVPLIWSTTASAQNGVWYTDDTDGADIDTDLFASPSYYPPPPACPRNIETTSYFNGVWQTGNAYYPHTSSLFEQVTAAGQGDHYWQTSWVDYGTVRSGLCGIVYYSPISQLYLSIATTWAQTVSDNGRGNCTVIPDCLPGVTPLCPQITPQRWTVIETDGGTCDPFHATYWLAYRTGSKTAPKACFSKYGLASPVPTGPGFCTAK